MSTDTVLAFCPQPKGLKEHNPIARARDEEWFALPQDLDEGFSADQCDNCGHNDYHAVHCTNHPGGSCTKIDVTCDECGWIYPTAWLPEDLAIF